MRVQPRPPHRSSAGVRFESFADGRGGVRASSPVGSASGQLPAAGRARGALTMRGEGASALLVLGFESGDHPVEEAMARALAICARARRRAERGARAARQAATRVQGSGGRCRRRGGGQRRGADPVASWREAFLARPYLRDVFVALGVIGETFETAITWERFPALHERVTRGRRGGAARAARGGRRERAASRTSTPTGPRPTSPCSRRGRRGRGGGAVGGVKRAVRDAILQEGRHDHPPPRGRARPPALV